MQHPLSQTSSAFPHFRHTQIFHRAHVKTLTAVAQTELATQVSVHPIPSLLTLPRHLKTSYSCIFFMHTSRFKCIIFTHRHQSASCIYYSFYKRSNYITEDQLKCICCKAGVTVKRRLTVYGISAIKEQMYHNNMYRKPGSRMHNITRKCRIFRGQAFASQQRNIHVYYVHPD